MILIEETTIPAGSLPLADFKAHLRMGSGFADDDLQDPVLDGFLRAALAAIEARTGKILLQRVFSLTLSEWHDPCAEPLPVAPVSSVVRLVLRDPRREDETIDPGFYRLVKDMQRPLLCANGTALPMISPGGTAELQFVAGFGAGWSALPADLAQAVMLLAAHYYENRSETNLSPGCMPFGVSSLIERYRTVRLFAGGGRR